MTFALRAGTIKTSHFYFSYYAFNGLSGGGGENKSEEREGKKLTKTNEKIIQTKRVTALPKTVTFRHPRGIIFAVLAAAVTPKRDAKDMMNATIDNYIYIFW